MDPFKIPAQELIDKGIYIEIPDDISYEEYEKIYSEFGKFDMQLHGIGIPDKTYFFSPESLTRLFQRYNDLVSALANKKIDILRQKSEHIYITEEKQKEFAEELIEKHTGEYLNPPDIVAELKKPGKELTEEEHSKVTIEIDEDFEFPIPTKEDLLSQIEYEESYKYRLLIEPSLLKSEMVNDDDLRYYIIKNEYECLEDYDLINSLYFKIYYQITLDKKVIEFVKEQILGDEEGVTLIDKFIKANSKPGISAVRKVMLLNEYGIIDYLLDSYTGLSINKLTEMLIPLLEEGNSAIRQPISAIRSVKSEQNKNNPYGNPENEVWLDTILRLLKLPPKKK